MCDENQQKKYTLVNILEDEYTKKAVVEITATDFEKEDIDIKMEGNTITIIGEAKKEFPEDNVYFQKRSTFKYFKRILTLYDEVEKVFAEMNDGILRLTIVSKKPKKPEIVKIEIK